MAGCGDIFLYIISFFLPPVGPFFKVGCGIEFWISTGLTLLGFLPGLVYAWCKYGSRQREEAGSDTSTCRLQTSSTSMGHAESDTRRGS